MAEYERIPIEVAESMPFRERVAWFERHAITDPADNPPEVRALLERLGSSQLSDGASQAG